MAARCERRCRRSYRRTCDSERSPPECRTAAPSLAERGAVRRGAGETTTRVSLATRRSRRDRRRFAPRKGTASSRSRSAPRIRAVSKPTARRGAGDRTCTAKSAAERLRLRASRRRRSSPEATRGRRSPPDGTSLAGWSAADVRTAGGTTRPGSWGMVRSRSVEAPNPYRLVPRSSPSPRETLMRAA